jgi:hypothetical protein
MPSQQQVQIAASRKTYAELCRDALKVLVAIDKERGGPLSTVATVELIEPDELTPKEAV